MHKVDEVSYRLEGQRTSRGHFHTLSISAVIVLEDTGNVTKMATAC